MRGTGCHRLYQRAYVHHRRGGGGNANSHKASKLKFCPGLNGRGSVDASSYGDAHFLAVFFPLAHTLKLARSSFFLPLSAPPSQVHTYERLTPFSILDTALESLDNLRPGDCIVCFSKNDIYSLSRQIEIRGLECAVIYGSLPPGEKLL